jgi:hypothetical protein
LIFDKKSLKHTLEKRLHFQQMLLGRLVIYLHVKD